MLMEHKWEKIITEKKNVDFGLQISLGITFPKGKKNILSNGME